MTDTATAPPPSSPSTSTADPEQAERARATRLYAATLLSALMLFASFHPFDLGALAWVALVPWLYAAATEGRRAAIGISYATTFLYHLVGLAWIGMVSPEGWVITSFLEGFYGIALALIPLWVRRRTGAPLLLSLPVAGAALEWLRGNTPVIRFPWLLLGATQHDQETLCQVADITSVYGLTFLVLAANGAIVDVALILRARWVGERDLDDRDRRRLLTLVLVPLGLLAVTFAYGFMRRAQVRAAMQPGATVLVVQPDFPQSLKDAPASRETIARLHLRMTRSALEREGAKVDAIIWSETMWPWPVPDERTAAGAEGWRRWLAERPPEWAATIQSYARQLQAVADESGAVLLTGALDWGLDGGPLHNSVYAIAPRQGVIARYDKINLVPASEYIPGKGVPVFSLVYDLVKSFVPEGFEVFAPGEGPALVPAGAGQLLAPNICFEISFPELLRESVRRGATAHVCPANDGWFVRGGRLDRRGRDEQSIVDLERYMRTAELALARDHAILRAIESRRPVVRCVNRGVSLVVDPTGEVSTELTQKVGGATLRVGFEDTFIATLQTTTLTTFYVRAGDAFALACLGGLLALIACGARAVRLFPDPEEGGLAPAPSPSPTSPPPEAPTGSPSSQA